MKKIALAFVLNFSLVFPTVAEDCTATFIDIDEHWAEEEICFLYNEGVVEGYSDRNYKPDGNVTRAEFLKISLLNLGYTVYSVQSSSFTDLTPGDWYYPYVTFAKSKGFVSGYPDGNFHPNEAITRAEAVTLITRIAEIIDYDVSSTIVHFYDIDSDDWFTQAVAVAVEYDIIEGYGDGSFRPQNILTRAEAAVIAVKTWEALY